jgi:riboflavin synthase
MFTGIIEAMGSLDRTVSMPPGVRLVIDAGELATGATIGASVAINGCCLTVVGVDGPRLEFDAGQETLARTNLGDLQEGDHVNLERSLVVGDRMGGHFVTGHIDTVGTLDRRQDDAEWSTFWFRVPSLWSRQLASKGSIAVDGVSLTLVDVTDDQFSVCLIPHTLKVTTLGKMKVGDRSNLETDVLAKYVQRQLEGEGSDTFPPQANSSPT